MVLELAGFDGPLWAFGCCGWGCHAVSGLLVSDVMTSVVQGEANFEKLLVTMICETNTYCDRGTGIPFERLAGFQADNHS